MIEYINGDITKQEDIQAIVHQCNCVSRNAAHLAKSIFSVFPWADIYKERDDRIIDYNNFPKGEGPGSIIIRGDGKDKRFVINLLGQVYPGRPRFPDSNIDGYKVREEFFQKALDKIEKIKGLKSIAFPDHIGCGAAGGNWGTYKKMIEDLSDKLDSVKVYIVKFSE
jgi:O-acetyl-ADP-ribose deacetylase (regulator of RNase III)